MEIEMLLNRMKLEFPEQKVTFDEDFCLRSKEKK